MSEPYPTYTTSTPQPIHSAPLASTAVDLEKLERALIASLKQVWIAQNKRKKIINLDVRR